MWDKYVWKQDNILLWRSEHPNLDPFYVQGQTFFILGLLYAEEPARQHDYNAANNKSIRVCGAEISSKMCTNPPRFVGT